MTVRELVDQLELKNWVPDADLEIPVTGGYAGDMLSWVMGRAQSGSVWMTIMSNQNVAAVALMADVAAVVLTESVAPDEALQKQAEARGLPLLSTPLSTYELSCRLGVLLADKQSV
ncbi:MAG: DRTGG domain-containing protein [Oscillospiraceae bacterium]|nr:DRTGG domain-containing protein [Oscillospiraceae bacterium]